MENEKATLRKSIRKMKQNHTSEELAEQSLILMKRLEAHERFRAAKVVMLFDALPDEPHTQDLLQRWAEEKVLLLPVVCGDELILKRYCNRASMQEGDFHIQEPTGDDFLDYRSIELVVVPGMAFDAAGHRLGRGKGYYDRFLNQPALQQAYKLGISFDFQHVPHVPTDEYDVVMDEVL